MGWPLAVLDEGSQCAEQHQSERCGTNEFESRPPEDDKGDEFGNAGRIHELPRVAPAFPVRGNLAGEFLYRGANEHQADQNLYGSSEGSSSSISVTVSPRALLRRDAGRGPHCGRWRAYRRILMASRRLYLPSDQLQIQDEDGIEHGHEQQRDERRQCEPTDLRVAQWLPQRSAVHGQRHKSEDRRADRDHHRPQPHNAGIQQRFAQRLAALVRFFDEIEEHDDVADDDARRDSRRPGTP